MEPMMMENVAPVFRTSRQNVSVLKRSSTAIDPPVAKARNTAAIPVT